MNESNKREASELSVDGLFPNGVSVVAIVRFIRANDYEARIDDIASYFGLQVEDVAAALEFHSRNFAWLHPVVLEGEK